MPCEGSAMPARRDKKREEEITEEEKLLIS
jgi:hypothetical protein